MANAIASSSQAVKRSSPNTTGPSSAKRARQSSTKHDDFDDEEDIDEDGAELDQSAKAKAERKAARIIRNRESAQRSRNQRKQHLAWLESRVIELERENRALRSGDTPSLSSSSSARESSPSQSVASFASDLGIPPEVVNSSGGVNLANVAPPPSDLDVKPVVEQCLNTVDAVHTSDLEMENAALRERVSLLENLVKQVVALSNLGSVPSATSQSSLATPSTSANPAMDWEALNHLTVPSTQSGGVTLSPAMYHATPLTATSDDSMTNPTVSLFENESVHGQKSGLDLTCHPAAGEDPFSLGIFGNEFGSFANSGSSSGGFGQSQGFDQTNFAMEQTGSYSSQSVDVQVWGQGSMGEEDWDEGMRQLLEDLEGRGVGGGNVQGSNVEVTRSQGIEWDWQNTSSGVTV